MKNLNFTIEELEGLEAPGWVELTAGVGVGIVAGAGAVGVGLLIT